MAVRFADFMAFCEDKYDTEVIFVNFCGLMHAAWILVNKDDMQHASSIFDVVADSYHNVDHDFKVKLLNSKYGYKHASTMISPMYENDVLDQGNLNVEDISMKKRFKELLAECDNHGPNDHIFMNVDLEGLASEDTKVMPQVFILEEKWDQSHMYCMVY